jgi:stage V sporulation protein SpoVS
MLHLTSSSNEHTAARNLVDNMPKRGQTVLRVAGPYAIENAVLAVALARPLMVAAWGQDLAFLVTWNANRAYNGAKTGLLLSVFRCKVGSFPPEVQVKPPSGPVEQQPELWQRARNKWKQQWQKQQQRKQANKQGGQAADLQQL